MNALVIAAVLFAAAPDAGSPADAGPAATPKAEAPAPASPDAAKTSLLHVRCQTKCIMYVDGLRQQSKDPRGVVLDVAQGEHQVYAKDFLNRIVGSGLVPVPARSEVWVVLSKGKAVVTNTKPL